MVAIGEAGTSLTLRLVVCPGFEYFEGYGHAKTWFRSRRLKN